MPKKVIKKQPRKLLKRRKRRSEKKKLNNLQKEPHLWVFQGIDIGGQGLIPEQHEHKNRAHIDLDVTDLEAAVQRAVGLGGTKLDEISEYGITWAVMADPDGNEFCLVQHS